MKTYLTAFLALLFMTGSILTSALPAFANDETIVPHTSRTVTSEPEAEPSVEPAQ